MSDPSLFKWRHFEADIILCAVRWYLRCALSDRDVEELLQERGVRVDHTTVLRWVQRDAPELDKRCRSYDKNAAYPPAFDSLQQEKTLPESCQSGNASI